MKVQLDKIEKILLGLLDPACQPEAMKLFQAYKENNLLTYANGFNTFSWYVKGPSEQTTQAVLCFIAGVMMADVSTKEEHQKLVFDDAIEYMERQRGENVVNFMEAKIDRR